MKWSFGTGDDWRPATVPGTVASNLGPELDRPGLDARDWWFRAEFTGEPGPARIGFDGLATLAEVWLNGTSILVSRNMFRPRTVDVVLAEHNELRIVFRALQPELERRRPRPRWRTALVANQNLRWVRTTLMGRIPSWTPGVACVGPWRAITVNPPEVDVRTSVIDGVPHVHGRGTLLFGDRSYDLEAGVALPGAALWSPDAPNLHDARIVTAHGTVHRRLGFRTVHFDEGFRVNGRPIFCRGACWMPDPLTLDGGEALLERARGLNMIRLCGTGTWAGEALLDACDRLGILVWQDFPFANMDPPFDDPEFRAEVEAEIGANVARLRMHPCVAAYCGGSELEQQAAMMGLGADQRRIPFLERDAPALVGDVPYFPSTPHGGALPFSTATGLTHYWGVGAYRRPLTDVRRAAVKFSPECLGFSNVSDGVGERPHHPAWKAGVPRDAGAGWDFEDVRDHYLSEMFGVDPVDFRSVDPERYLAISRAVTGELMLRTFAEWRRPGSGCAGALVWFLRDLRPGAGWGVFTNDGRPKAAFRYLARAWAPRAVLLTDEGLDGVGVHVHNETDAPLDGVVDLELWNGRTKTGTSSPVRLAAWSAITLSGDALMGAFHDLAYAYRFGPPKHEAVVARLRADGKEHTDVLFPGGHALRSRDVSVLEAVAARGGSWVDVTVSAVAFVQTVTIEAEGWDADDDAFHVVPGSPHAVRFTGSGAFKAHVSALNLDGTLTLRA